MFVFNIQGSTNLYNSKRLLKEMHSNKSLRQLIREVFHYRSKSLLYALTGILYLLEISKGAFRDEKYHFVRLALYFLILI